MESQESRCVANFFFLFYFQELWFLGDLIFFSPKILRFLGGGSVIQVIIKKNTCVSILSHKVSLFIYNWF